MAIIELPWRPGDVDQAEGRTHRFTHQRACTCYYHLAHGTIEDFMYDLISNKRAIADAALDGVVQPEEDRIMAYQVLARLREKVKARRLERAAAIKQAGGRPDYVDKKFKQPMKARNDLVQLWND